MPKLTHLVATALVVMSMPLSAPAQGELPEAARIQLEHLQATSSAALRPVVRDQRVSWLGGLREPVVGHSPEAMAADFVIRYAPLVGLSPEMSLDVPRSRVHRGTSFVRFGVTVEGLPVLGSQVVISTRDGLVRHMATSVRPLPPANVDGPLITPDEAASAVVDATGSHAPSPTQLAWLPLSNELVPVWVVEQREISPPRDWRVIVEARTGAVLSRFDQFQRVEGFVFEPNPEVAGGDGMFTRVELPELESDTVLEGARARAFQCGGIPEGDCTSREVPCRYCGLRNHLATADVDGNYLYVPNEPDIDDEFAEVQAYYHTTIFSQWLEETFDFWRSCNGSRAIDTHVNFHIPGDVQTSANAFYGDVDGDGCGDITLGEGMGIDFSYDGDVIYHEYGHGVVEAVGGLGCYPMGVCLDEMGPDWTSLGLNEGYADFFSVAFTGDPDLGEHAGDAFSSGEGLIRTASNDHLCPFDLVGESHYDAQIWTGTGWDIRESLGEELSDQLFYRTLMTIGNDAGYAEAAAALLAAADEMVEDGDMTDDDRTELSTILGPEGRRIEGCERIIPLDEIPEGHAEEFLLLYSWRGTSYYPAGLQWSITAPRRARSLRFWVEEDYLGADALMVHVRKDEPVGIEFDFNMQTHSLTIDYTADFEVELTDGELELTPETDLPLEENATYYFAVSFVCAYGCLLRPRGEVEQAPGDDPVSDAGDDQEVMVGDTVDLDGSASHDPDGDELTYLWEQTAGADVEIEGADGPTPSFVVEEAGDHAFELTVTDLDGDHDSDRVVIRVSGSDEETDPDGDRDGGTSGGDGDDGGCGCRAARDRPAPLAVLLSLLP